LQPAVQDGLAHGWYKGLYADSEAAVHTALEQAAVEGKDLTQALTEANTELAATRSQVAPDPNPVVVATPGGSIGPSNGVPVIQFYVGNADAQEVQALQSLVERFNREHTEQFSVSLVTSYSPPENQGYFEGLANTFDCFVAQVDPIGAATSDAVLELNSFLDGEPPAFRQDYDTALLDRSRYEGALYDLPLVSQPAVMAFNADLLASRGLSLPSNNWTYDDFVQHITTIAASKGADKVYGVLPESQAVDMLGMLYAGRNVQWLDISGNVPVAKLDTPEMASSLIWLSELFRSRAAFQSATGEAWWASITRAIQSGQIAYWTVLAGQQNSLYFDEGQQPSFRVGIALLPSTTASVAFDASIERGLYIARQTSYAPACWSWARYLSEQPVSWYGVPARTSVAASPAWEASVGAENAGIYRLALARLQGTRMEGKWKLMVLPLNSWRGQVEIGVRHGEDVSQLLVEAQRKATVYQACLAQEDISTLNEADLSSKVTDCAKQADPSW
ncbi:MAG TPA: extracellular solute-binding protein, partial [Anaerolineaceae bacterium]|nr:extracellular solute-binding protein [Anaerolineaceae bacterium]